MAAERNHLGWGFLGWWVLASTIGWVVGLIGAIIVAHVANIVYPKETNLVVGLCLGAAVGCGQWVVLRRRLAPAGRWVWASAVGMGIPFVVAVVAEEIWSGLSDAPYAEVLSVTLVVAVGGLLTGWLQLPVLRPHSPRLGLWVAASAVGWGLGWSVTGLIMLGGILLSGVALGAVTGGVLIQLLNPRAQPGDDQH